MTVQRAFLFVLALVAGVLPAADAVPQRIISLSPSVTEILYGVGAFPQVIAVSQYCVYPPEVKNLPRVGGWETSNAEKIGALRPDLVVLTRSQQPFISEKLQALSLRSLAVPAESVADVLESIREIGNATGHAQAGAELAAKTRASLDKMRAETRNVPRRGVLLVISRTPGSLADMYVATDGSFLAELLEVAGGKSVAAPAKGGYARLSKEALLALDPEVILDVVHNPATKMSESAAEVWNDLPSLRAVREKHVYALDDMFLVHPSQFITHTAGLFKSVLHPELATAGAH